MQNNNNSNILVQWQIQFRYGSAEGEELFKVSEESKIVSNSSPTVSECWKLANVCQSYDGILNDMFCTYRVDTNVKMSTVYFSNLKGCVEELSNFTYLVLAAVALFRSVSLRFIMFFFTEKYMWIFQKVSKLYYWVIKFTRLKSALAALIE